MTEEELREYIKRFPKSTQQALEYDKVRINFLHTVRSFYKPIKVYRAVNCVSNFSINDFMPIPEEKEMTSEQVTKRIKNDKALRAGFFGVSVNENLDEMIVSLKFPSARHANIVYGEMCYENGVADFEDGKTHHNWYIFMDKIDEVLKSFHFVKLLIRRR